MDWKLFRKINEELDNYKEGYKCGIENGKMEGMIEANTNIAMLAESLADAPNVENMTGREALLKLTEIINSINDNRSFVNESAYSIIYRSAVKDFYEAIKCAALEPESPYAAELAHIPDDHKKAMLELACKMIDVASNYDSEENDDELRE